MFAKVLQHIGGPLILAVCIARIVEAEVKFCDSQALIGAKASDSLVPGRSTRRQTNRNSIWALEMPLLSYKLGAPFIRLRSTQITILVPRRVELLREVLVRGGRVTLENILKRKIYAESPSLAHHHGSNPRSHLSVLTLRRYDNCWNLKFQRLLLLLFSQKAHYSNIAGHSVFNIQYSIFIWDV